MPSGTGFFHVYEPEIALQIGTDLDPGQAPFDAAAIEANTRAVLPAIEIIGTYEPRQDPSVINIDNERAVHWLSKGAQPTDRVEKLLKISGAWTEHTGDAVDASVPEREPRKSKKQLEKEADAAAEAEAPAADESDDEASEGDE